MDESKAEKSDPTRGTVRGALVTVSTTFATTFGSALDVSCFTLPLIELINAKHVLFTP